MATYDLSPRDIALYQRSNEYLSRLNDLDPYSQEYANVYSDYVDTIDQLSNRDFRASLGSTLLEFAPMTRPRAQPRASASAQQPKTSETAQQPKVSEPVQLAPADNILYRNRPPTQQEFHRPVPITPSTTSFRDLPTLGQDMSLAHVRSLPIELALTYQTNMDTLRTAPEPIQLAPADNILYRREFDPVPVAPRMAPSYELKSPPIKLAKMYEANTKKLRAAPEPAQEATPMMMEGSLPLVEYPNNITLSPFTHSSPYAEALSRVSWPGQAIPITNDWY